MVKEIWSFLGFCNFYRHFIANYAILAKPLTCLTESCTQWQWGKTQMQAFNVLEQHFQTVPILHQPHYNKPFCVSTNDLLVAIGIVLEQEDDNGAIHPCAFYSRMLLTAECNYNIYNCKLLAVDEAFKHWHIYQMGSSH